MIITRMLLTTSAMLAALLSFAGSSHATDTKVYHANGCTPAFAKPSTAVYTNVPNGVVNSGPAIVDLLCPVVRDQVSGNNGPIAGFRVYDASATAEVCCSLLSYDLNGTQIGSATACTGTAATPGWVTLGPLGPVVSDPANGAYEAECRLGVGTRFTNYYVREFPQVE